MMKIIADSSCDMISYGDDNFEAVPLTINTDEVTYTDDIGINVHGMLEELEKYKGRSYTACPGTSSWLKAFDGADTIYVVTMTSGLSGTYNSAMVARNMYLQDHPEVRIEIFDTLSTGPEMRLVIEKIVELNNKGYEFEHVCRMTREYINHTRLFFSFVSLHNFSQNGRVSKVVASAVGMLGISIIGTASEEGKIQPITKCRGEKKVISRLMEELNQAGYCGGKIRICHVENQELAEKFSDSVINKYPHADINIYPARGICSYYGERGGIIIGCECKWTCI